MSRFKTLSKDFAASIGLPLNGEIESPFEIALDGFTIVASTDTRSDGEDLVLYTGLGTVPAARELEVYRVLLEANVLWSGTGNATLGVNSATREAMIAYRMPMSLLDGESLAALVGRFLEIARGWRNTIEAANEAQDEASAAPGDASSMILRL